MLKTGILLLLLVLLIGGEFFYKLNQRLRFFLSVSFRVIIMFLLFFFFADISMANFIEQYAQFNVAIALTVLFMSNRIGHSVCIFTPIEKYIFIYLYVCIYVLFKATKCQKMKQANYR